MNPPPASTPPGRAPFAPFARFVFAAAAVVAGVFLVPGCATNPVSGQSELVLMSEDEELEIGQRLSKVLPGQYGGPYENRELAAYITGLGETIAGKSHRPELIYHFTVLDSPVINAFALPGGYIYITRGMLAHLNAESELAAVLAHEIGHVTARHGVRQHAKSTLLALLAEAAIRATGAGSTWRNLAGFVNTAIVRGYGRAAELEADRLGARYIANVGYKPQQMLEVLGVLKAHEEYEKQRAREEKRPPAVYHGLFATHPDNDDRLQEVVRESASMETAGTIEESPEDFLRRLEGLVYGASARQGTIRGANFYHELLGITLTFPQGWIIENRPDRLQARTRDNGAVIMLTLRDRNRRESAEKYLRRQFPRGLEQAAPLGGALEGYTARVKTQTPYGRRTARIAAVFKDKQVYQFVGACKDDDRCDGRDAEFVAAMESLRAMKPEEKALAAPRVIGLVRAQDSDTIAALASASPLNEHAAEKIRLLNALYPGGEPQAGRLLKVPK